MITYTIVIIGGSIHKPFIALQWGTTALILECAPLRDLIQAAKEKSIYSVLERIPECQREILAFIYEEYHDKL